MEENLSLNNYYGRSVLFARCGYVPLVVSTSRSFSHSWLITGFVTRLTRRVPLVEKELLTLPENLSSPSSLVVYVCFEDGCLFFCLLSFGHCDVWSLIYGFWLPLWYHPYYISFDCRLDFLTIITFLPCTCIYHTDYLIILLKRYIFILKWQFRKSQLCNEYIYCSVINTW
jgi:hypothetical protein